MGWGHFLLHLYLFLRHILNRNLRFLEDFYHLGTESFNDESSFLAVGKFSEGGMDSGMQAKDKEEIEIGTCVFLFLENYKTLLGS